MLAFDQKYKYGYPDEIWFSLEDMPGEEWKDVKDFEGRYIVSSYGRIKSLSRLGRVNDRILYLNKTKYGYFIIGLRKPRVKRTWFFVARLVAEYFCIKNKKPEEINHLDGKKKNNFYRNLEWTTASENSLHAFRNGLRKANPLRGGAHPSSKKIKRIDIKIH